MRKIMELKGNTMKNMNRMNLIVFSFSLILSIFLISPAVSQTFGGVNQSKLQKAFARLDRAYIPSMALTGAEKVKPSAKAMKALEKEWKLFKSTYYNSNLSDNQWQTDLDRVGKNIGIASTIVASETELVRAHEILENVRLIFWDLRERNGIDYFLDNLTQFHGNMEAIFLAAKGKNPSSLSKKDIAVIQKSFPEAKTDWKKATTAKFHPELFGFSEKKANMVQQLIQEESVALNNLEETLRGTNRLELIKAAGQLKPPFAKLFKLFGDFNKFK